MRRTVSTIFISPLEVPVENTQDTQPIQAQSGLPIEFRFGDRLRQMRSERQLSQVDLAWQVGISRAHLEDIEDGAEIVDLTLLASIACALGLSLSAALCGM